MKISKKWSRDQIIAEAKKYNSREDFRKNSSYVYKLACSYGILDEACSHMKRLLAKKGYWTKEIILSEAKKYTYKIDFLNGCYPAYRAAQNLNILNEICSHMASKPHLPYWTEQKIIECAKKYNKKIEFQKENTGAYAAARKLGIADSVCSHMEFKNHQSGSEDSGRICKKCNEFKLKYLMSKSSKCSNGMDSICKKCKNEYSKERLKNHPHKFNAHTAYRRSMRKKATPIWVTKDHKKLMVDKYKQAKIKTQQTGIIHEVDHIVPLVSKFACGLHLPWNLRVITKIENRIKSNKIIDHV